MDKTKNKPVNTKEFQLTMNGSLQIKRFPAYYEIQDTKVLYRLSTFLTNQFYFEIVLN